MKSKLSTPMQTTKDQGREWPGSHDHLALPINQPALKQPATPNACGIRMRTGEVKPGAPGGSSTVRSPMADSAVHLNPNKVK